MTTTELADRATRLYEDALIWDDHCGLEPKVDADLAGELEHYLAAGVNYLSVNVGYDVMPWHETVRVIAQYRSVLEAHRDRHILADSADDVLAAKAEGKLAVTFDLEGMDALDGDPAMISLYRQLGVRQILFAYNRNNLFASGCHDEDTGLTALGRLAVEEMNRVGILVDCTHTGYRATLEAMELTAAPAIFSHSNPTAVWPHARNIRDEQIKACAATGGVIGINGVGIFLGKNDTRTSTLARHVQYVAELVGPEYVGLGLDCELTGRPLEEIVGARPDYWPPGHGYDTPGIGFATSEQLPGVAEILLASGFSERDVRGILGENFLRVAREAWTPGGA